MVVASSIAALFLRGFKVQNLAEQMKSKDLQTPSMDVWLVETQGYNSKMDAYQAGLVGADNGLGVYVLPTANGKWIWVAGVYSSENDANTALTVSGVPAAAEIKHYQIHGKKFSIDVAAVEPGQQVLSAVQNVFKLLLDLRKAISAQDEIKNLQLDLTTQYNQIKSSADTLQNLNANLQSQLLATLIYTANQNILGLQEIIYTNEGEALSLATVNTALLKTIFSLDNF